MQLEGTEEMLRRREKECSSLKKKLDDSRAQVEELNHSRNTTVRYDWLAHLSFHVLMDLGLHC